MRTNFERNCPYRAKNSIFQHQWVKKCLFTLCIASQKSTAYAVKCKQIFLDSSMLKKWIYCSVWYGSFKICKNLQDFQLRQIVIIFAKKKLCFVKILLTVPINISPRKKGIGFRLVWTCECARWHDQKMMSFLLLNSKRFRKIYHNKFLKSFLLKKDMVEN